MYVLERCRTLNHHPAVKIFASCWLEAITRGHIPDDTLVLDPRHECLLAREWDVDGKKLWVGGSLFAVREGVLHICFTAIAHSHRGNGLYSQLYRELREMGRREGCHIISSMVSPLNSSMKSAMRGERELTFNQYDEAL